MNMVWYYLNCASPLRKFELEISKLYVGSGHMEVGSRKREVDSGKWTHGSWKPEVGSKQWEVDTWKWKRDWDSRMW